ncbi:MAG: nitronate monooxygenase, partial [Oscillospiraceae bacterium]
EELADVVIKENIKVVTTGAGNPSKYMKKWLDAGIKVIPVVPSASLAKLAQRNGASAVIAEGGESGGHIGELSTMALVPIICDAVTIPVIAAGGIVDGRGLAASFMLGAQGIQVGTRFLVAHECTIHQNYKDKVLKAKDTDSITTGKKLGHPVRSLKTPYSRQYFKMEYDSSVSNEELEAFGAGALRKAVKDGDLQDGCFIAGQVAALVNKEQSCKEIIEDIFTQGEKILKGEENKTYNLI